MADIDTQDGEIEPLDLEEEAGEGEQEDESEELSIEIEAEEEDKELPAHLRREIRDRDRRLAEYEQAYGSVVKDPGDVPIYGDGSDYNFDEEVYNESVRKYTRDKLAFDNQQSAVQRQKEIQQREEQARQTNYFSKMAAIQVPQETKDAAQAAVVAALSEPQQAAILRYAKDPAKVVVALGKSPNALSSLARETDLGSFILKMAEMQGKITVKPKGKLPAPESESIQRGSAPVSRTSANKAEDAALEKGDIKKFRELRAARLAKA